MDYGKHINEQNTPQSQPLFGRQMIKNEAGGYGFEKSPWQRMHNFLMLGSEGGTYYVGERELTIKNAENSLKCLQEDGKRFVEEVMGVSQSGRAPKNDPAIFLLALACAKGDTETKAFARAAIPEVCRTGTHLFTFMQAYKDVGGQTSRGFKRAVAKFYTERTPDKVAYQLVKYRQRNGWAHRDVMRLTHPKGKPGTPHGELFRWAVGKEAKEPGKIIRAFETIQKSTDASAAMLAKEYGLPWEALPTELLKEKKVWEALLPDMGYTALLRQLGRLSSIGFLDSEFSENVKMVKSRLLDFEGMKKARIHPFHILLAYSTYMQGKGVKGKLTWSPVSGILDALDDAFWISFQAAEPTGKNLVIGVDVSGSMNAQIQGSHLTAAEGAVIMALIHKKIEPAVEIVPFDTRAQQVAIPKRGSLKEYLATARSFRGGGTDCSIPIRAAYEAGYKADAFIIYTDSQSWYGDSHPVGMLKAYRAKHNKDAKLVVVEQTPSKSTIADPELRGCLSISGMDASVPGVIAEFLK